MSKSKSQERREKRPTPPEPLQADTITARILRDHLWRPPNLNDDWRVFAIVGRENTGKSLTCASILAAVDPEFSIDNMHFDPVPFLEDIGTEMATPGRAMMSDETGVGFGNRTWHDREQVEANQYLQTARRHNRIVGMTAPRLEEIDKQLRGRMHVLFETVSKRDGEYVSLKVKLLNPTRTGEDVIRTPFPRKRVDGRVQRVKQIKVGPPPAKIIKPYEEKKATWQADLKDRVIESYEDDEEEAEQLSPKDIAEKIKDDHGIEQFVGDNHGQKYIDKNKIAAEFGIGHRGAGQVKSLLKDEVGDDVM